MAGESLPPMSRLVWRNFNDDSWLLIWIFLFDIHTYFWGKQQDTLGHNQSKKGPRSPRRMPNFLVFRQQTEFQTTRKLDLGNKILQRAWLPLYFVILWKGFEKSSFLPNQKLVFKIFKRGKIFSCSAFAESSPYYVIWLSCLSRATTLQSPPLFLIYMV